VNLTKSPTLKLSSLTLAFSFLKWWRSRESNPRPQQLQFQVIHKFSWFIPKPTR